MTSTTRRNDDGIGVFTCLSSCPQPLAARWNGMGRGQGHMSSIYMKRRLVKLSVNMDAIPFQVKPVSSGPSLPGVCTTNLETETFQVRKLLGTVRHP